jgi:L-ascorbate metabolism protein UlaG (beta-lactamase superfamily)
MRLTKFSHACVRFERDGAVLVVDPGNFTEREALDGADAVLFTHSHPDHFDLGALTDALAGRPSIAVYSNADVAARLTALGDLVTTVDSGQSFTAAGFDVRAYGGWHSGIHPDLPQLPNLGFLIGDVYHPGDSFDLPEGMPVDTLFVPVSAPWLKIAEAIDFVRAVGPRQAYALHDAMYKEPVYGLVQAQFDKLALPYARLAPGEHIAV